ncbi:MAG: DEAD/DEAH box helicase, partial [Candidatus Peribacteraceae bacterium]|nr:DEAD/DEAH box helicase [Candidatus Peribacteraceae bacterium]
RVLAQRLCALLFEISDASDLSVAYAIQLLYSRLGNFPAISNCKVFQEHSVLEDLSGNLSSLDFDPEIIANLLREKDAAKYAVKIDTTPIYLNDEQLRIVSQLETKTLVSFSAPTSFGKSFIIRNFIAKKFADLQLHRCLVLVPSKSLIDGFFEDFLALKNTYNLPYSIRTHVRSIEDLPENCIFILTQERLSFLLSKYPEIVRSFQIIYCDEAHSISKGYRGFLLRKVLQQSIDLCQRNAKYIFSSPLIKNPQYYRERLFSNLLAENDTYHEVINFAPVERMLYLIQAQNEECKYFLCSQAQAIDLQQENVIKQLRISPVTIADDSEIKSNIEIVLNSGVKGGTILYTTGKTVAHRYAYYLAESLSENQVIDAERLRDLDQYINTHFHRGFGIISLLKRGVGIHHGAIPVGLRREIVKLFEEGLLQYLVCTSTLLEGVNLPAKNIFLFSNKHYGNAEHDQLSFWNLVGRAGRLKYDLSGNVFCIARNRDEYDELLTHQGNIEITEPELQATEKTRRNYALETLKSYNNRDYVRSTDRDSIEYFLFELLTAENSQAVFDRSTLAQHRKRNEILGRINTFKSEININQALLNNNPGIDPRAQNDLWRYLRRKCDEAGIGRFHEVLFSPVYNPFTLNGDQLGVILGICSQHLHFPKQPDRVDSTANRMVRWLHESTIGEFINTYVPWIRTEEGLSEIERRMTILDKMINYMSKLEREVSFEGPKFLKCFYDIAISVFIEKGGVMPDIEDKIDGFLFSLEAGLSHPVTRMLYEKGVSRSVAISVKNSLPSGHIELEYFKRPQTKSNLESTLTKLEFQELYAHIDN